jgi:acyl-CoA dehydrogenase
MAAGWTLWNWPFFDPSHHSLAEQALDWNAGHPAHDEVADEFAHCRAIARDLGDAGLLRHVVPEEGSDYDLRAICLLREALTYHHALHDVIFSMQGIGTLGIRKFGSELLRAKYLGPCRDGRHIAALALTEPASGSDVANMTTSAVKDGTGYVVNGDKTLITNAGFADHYLLIARTGEAPGSRGLSAFVIDAETPGLTVGPPIHFIAPHPGAALHFSDCRISADQMVGVPGQGFKVAMGALDIFRPSVGAAGVGLARRALDETMGRVTTRHLFGKPMAELQAVQMALADMATDIDLAALSVYRAAWERDHLGARGSYAASMAKLAGSEAAGRVVDRAVQLFGGMGVTQGNLIEQLYREARPMRIYEGASEVQKLIIARALLAPWLPKA